MPNEFHFELAFNAAWVQQCLDAGAETVIVSGKLSLDGNHVIELKAKNGNGVVPLELAVMGCPMPCLAPPQPGTSSVE